ncbi:MAG TPA: hypothetical protein PK961_03950 [bacterium]|nr:hypothetical protein [bacterium]
MKNFPVLLFLILAALCLTLAGGCSCDDDDDDNDDNDSSDNDDDDDNDAADDDTTDDDDADDDDDTTDDDADDDDDDTPPYNTELCEPAMAAIYEDCHLSITVGETPLTREEAVASCENVEYLFWPCALDCYLDYEEDCLAMYVCLQECIAE